MTKYDDLDRGEEENLKQELEEMKQQMRQLRIEKQRKEVEIRCLEYVEFRRACEDAVEDQPVMYPDTNPLRN